MSLFKYIDNNNVLALEKYEIKPYMELSPILR